MARAKNRGLQQSFSPSYTVRRWRLGEYIRLSKEDLKKGKDDSNSVINQRDLLNDFYQKHIGEFESVSEYVDDGHTRNGRQPGEFPAAPFRCNERENKLRGSKKTFPVLQEITAMREV